MSGFGRTLSLYKPHPQFLGYKSQNALIHLKSHPSSVAHIDLCTIDSRYHFLQILSAFAINQSYAFLAAVNASTPSTKVLATANSSASITSPPNPVITGVTSCLPCLVAAFNLQNTLAISQIFWYSSTFTLPLDTISVSLLEYGNTTVTSSTTIYGNITSFTESIAPQVSNLIQSDFPAFTDGLYGGAGFAVANGTDGAIPGGVTAFPFSYPTPYIAVAGISVFTNLPSAGCLLNQPQYVSSLIDAAVGAQGLMYGVGSFTVDLRSTFYSPLPQNAASGFFGQFELDAASFSEFLASNTSLVNSIPYLASCSYLTFGVGPPMLQLPAAALTTTVKTTIKENGPYPTSTPAPGSPIRPSVPAQTTIPIQGSNQGSTDQISPQQGASNQGSPNPEQGSPTQITPSQDSPNQVSPNQSASNIALVDNPNLQEGKSPAKIQPSQPGPGSGNPTDQGSGPLDIIPASGSQGAPNQASDVPQNTSPTKVVAAPAIPYAGTIIQPNEASQYDLPEIGTLSPGGPGVTTNGIIYSLAPSATAIVSNGINIPITPIANTPAVSAQPGILSFGGTLYTADTSSRFLIAGKTIVPAGPVVTISGTPISIAPGATAALIGTKIVPIVHNPAGDIPTIAPILTFAGSTYTADPSSTFLIEGQTLTPGARIEVQGTQISYPSGGSVVVVGSSTEPLSFATTTPPAVAPVLTFDGSTYTADASSNFNINGQNLAPGGIVTVSGTPISYAAAESAVVIGSSTESFLYAKITPTATLITFDGSTYTADASSDFVIKGQTLGLGGVITVSGTPISYASGGTDVVIGTSTEAVGIGGLIMSGFGGGGGPASTGAVSFTGGSVGQRKWSMALVGTAVALSFCSALLL